MKLLPPFHLETEPRKDFGMILGKIHRFSFDGSKFLHDVTVNPNPQAMEWNVLTIGSVLENPSVVHKFTESFIWWSIVENILDLEEGPAQLFQCRKDYTAQVQKTGSASLTSRKNHCIKQLKTYFGNVVGHMLAKTRNGQKKKRQVVVPITTMEFPFYDLGLEALNYGITGFIIAHEMGHAMDEIGSGYDAEGNQKHCLTENSRKTFDKIIHRFIETYNKYEVYFVYREPIPVNGKISVNENMADWQGFNMALMAYKMYEKEYGIKPKLIQFEHLSPEKLFTLAFASEFCVMPRIHYLVRQATRMIHPPESIRVNAILQNSRQFSEVWGCADGSPMNPPDKCEIWL
ncbi:hypothetical protein V9T40_000820 [Parthenolecanium corni]|uniref:Peptidase M13 C-terminal domain-containing protein n=1 Tax=Parthenolecanium corni TaxID=536013 RepID=A0AAN9TBP7_9HEMI